MMKTVRSITSLPLLFIYIVSGILALLLFWVESWAFTLGMSWNTWSWNDLRLKARLYRATWRHSVKA